VTSATVTGTAGIGRMAVVQGVLTGLGAIWAVTAIGYVLARINLLGESGSAVLARVAFFVATPALVFETLARSDPAAILTPALAVFVVSTVVVAAAYLVVARILRRPAPDATIGALAASYVNSANVGLPVAAYVLGDVAFIIPVMLFQLLVAAPVGLAVLDATTMAGRPTLAQAALLPFRNPILIVSAAGLAVAVSGWRPPDAALAPFELVGAAAVPLALLALGLTLPGARPFAPAPHATDRYLASALKIVVQPAIAFGVGRALRLDDTMLRAAVVASALPTAQNVFVFASRHGRATPLARDVIVLTTLAATVSLFVVVTLVDHV
jgi:malonate transporter and related proteins